MTTSDDVRVTDSSERSRFEITVRARLAGFAAYHLVPGRIVFTHTEIGEDYQGRGLAGQLAGAALSRARASGLRVTPLCPYIAGYIRKHPEYVDLVDEHHRAQVSSPGRQRG